ncbi:phosphatidate cytidylyltransferase [Candidatus Profftia sp. (ex Adelges kitamiensis)]|uniref:phosphatidate cytidylyltransferase n=1 Tax=Candidatus Profftia sp. (ex Adelges kitamiensis) TaxID=2864218 RepID=UPI001CE2AA34|nr:phosphatidate cytidylyltransferase [Candidatus Profftia sp. (ex Adelges kitamiensis)]
MLKFRIITTVILTPIIIASLFLLPPIGFSIITLVICMLAAWEWGQLAGFTVNIHRMFIALFFGVLLALLMYNDLYKFNVDLRLTFNSLWVSIFWWITALLLVLFYPQSAWWWKHSRILKIIFGAATIIPFFGGVIALRQYGYATDYYQGAWHLLYIMCLVWGADSGAYIFGNIFGKNKLCPQVSLGKTWEGFIGGLTTTYLISRVLGLYVPITLHANGLLFYSIVAVLTSILGDLTESMFKREAGIKDSSHLIPGHGGILDRIDSLTAAVPIFAYLILLVF